MSESCSIHGWGHMYDPCPKCIGNASDSRRDNLEQENATLRAALSELSNVYTHCWDLVDGGLILMPSSMERFENANAGARKALGFNDIEIDDEN